MTRYFTSDLHIGHQKIIELCGRPFESVAQMNQAIIDNWNYEVENDDDQVFILGDLAMGNIRESLDVVKELKGQKFLVPGNHDRVHPCYPQKAAKGEEMRRLYEDAGLTILGLEVDFLPTEEDRQGPWKLCHFPTSGDSYTDDRYPEYRPELPDGDWLIHGHVHNMWRVNGRQINVGVDVWGFTPVMEDAIQLMMDNGVSNEFAANFS